MTWPSSTGDNTDDRRKYCKDHRLDYTPVVLELLSGLGHVLQLPPGLIGWLLRKVRRDMRWLSVGRLTTVLRRFHGSSDYASRWIRDMLLMYIYPSSGRA